MKIIRKRNRVERKEYALSFVWKDCPSAGFNFPCDSQGNTDLNECARDNYQKCINGEYDVIDEGIIEYDTSYTECAIGLCSCGKRVYLDSFTNTCEWCGRDYNMQGDLLASRRQWGEETGEHWSECY